MFDACCLLLLYVMCSLRFVVFLFGACWLTCVACVLFVVYCLLFVVCCCVRCLLFVARYELLVVSCVLCLVYCVLFVVCCFLLFVAC